jgi:arylsulfatase A-like enzyme
MPERPNILIIMSDHERADVLQPDHPCPTPHATRLAEEGVRFTGAYTVSTHCCPSRASFMTGLYPSAHGIFNNVQNRTALHTGLNPGVRTWSETLAEQGYRLRYTGKWHVSAEEDPHDRGWEEFGAVTALGKYPSAAEAPPPGPRDAETKHGYRDCVWMERDGWPDVLASAVAPRTVAETLEARQTRDTIAMIEQLAEGDQPWCLNLGWVTPHDPYIVPADLADRIDPASVPLPANFRDDLTDRPALYRRQRRLLWDQLTEDEVRLTLARFWTLCAMMDDFLGEILAALEATGQADNTLLIRTADHGDLLGDHGLFLKGVTPYEGAYRVPLILRWPQGIANPGREVHSLANLTDLGPTILEAAGAPPLSECHGRSLLPLLTGDEPDGQRDEFYSQMNGVELYYTQRIMRVGRYKYIFNGFDFDELYDLEADPGETRNRIDDPTLETVRRRLLARLWDWVHKTGDWVDCGYPPVGLVPVGPYPTLRKEPLT